MTLYFLSKFKIKKIKGENQNKIKEKTEKKNKGENQNKIKEKTEKKNKGEIT